MQGRSLELVEKLHVDLTGHLGPEDAGAWEVDFHLVARLHAENRSFRTVLDVWLQEVRDLADRLDLVASFEGCHDSP
ncbi:MAG: hypothetical protein JWO99_347 [Candidatus Saccharibacteria bacterium]|nr:hypothetical protein [Candidatus Saccharibacteria bacterium]